MFHNKRDDDTVHKSAVQERGKKKRTQPASSPAPTPWHRAPHHTSTESTDTTGTTGAEPTGQQPAPMAKIPVKSIIAMVGVFILLSIGASWSENNPVKPPEREDTSDETDPFAEISQHIVSTWGTTIDGEAVSATKTREYNYGDCDGIELGEALTDLGCNNAVEARYEAKNHEVTLDLTIMTTTTPAQAAHFAAHAESDDFALHHLKTVPENNYLRWRIAAQDAYVIAVRCEADKDVPETIARHYLKEFVNDHIAKVANE